MGKLRVLVGMGTCGMAAGAEGVMNCLQQLLEDQSQVELLPTGCVGLCESEVVVELQRNGQRIIYGDITEDKVSRLVEEAILGDNLLKEWILAYPGQKGTFSKQQRMVLENCGLINPENIQEYVSQRGYQGLEKALKEMSSHEVIEQVKQSGLRGRGGGGFPTGMKWEFTRKAPGSQKYVICNADEGDPGAFMDRSIMEGDPHALLEGMLIAGYAIGADQGYIYVRAEYPLAIKRLEKAISDATDRGYIGSNILGSTFSFQLKIKKGAGAFVCGEETALLASIEGRRGMPRSRPPFPANSGLWKKPTNINNVETYVNVPRIIRDGADRYQKVGSKGSKGTKVFALTGNVKKTGLVEVPMGISLREIIYEIGGGIKGDKDFKAVQIGGPSGGCIPKELLDLPVDYDSLVESGAIMGSGGLVVMDEDTCMVDVARFFLDFTQRESCGKCTPCREGTKRMLEILERITSGEGALEDLSKLEYLASNIKQTSLCGLGQTAPNPVLSTLRFFHDEYEAHIQNKRCPAASCPSLLGYYVVADLCIGCTKCAKTCPVQAISGELKQAHSIDQSICIKCDSCVATCPVSAIIKK